jgi:uncharacterized protein (TIGR02145 family)
MVLRAISFAIAVMLVLIACNSFKFDDELPSSSPSSSSSLSSSDGGGSSSSGSPSSSSLEAIVCADADKCGGQCYDKDAQFCYNGEPHNRCGGNSYNVTLKFCCGGDIYDKAQYGCCANVNYLLSGFGCRDGEVMDRCGDEGLYNPALQFCAADLSTQWLCGGNRYDYPEQYCEDNVVKGTCGGEELDPAAQFCYDGRPYGLCGGDEYNPSFHFCSGNAPYALCGGAEYNPATHFCSGNAPYPLCGGDEYNPETQFCAGGSVQGNCGEAAYDPQTQFCRGDAVYARCGGATYTASQFCQPGTNEVKDLCGGEPFTAAQGCCGSSKYTLATHFCQAGSNAVKELCGNMTYAENQFCQSPGVVQDLGNCGSDLNPLTEGCCGNNKYILASQFCQDSTNAVKTLCNGATYAATQFCFSTSIVDKCGGTSSGAEYNPATERCCGSSKYNSPSYYPEERCGANNIVEFYCSGSGWYNVATHFCYESYQIRELCGGATYTNREGCCGGNKYTLNNQFCQAGELINKCGNSSSGPEYDPLTESCCAYNKYTLATEGCCAASKYTLATHFCQASSNVKAFCNGETYTSTQFCSGTSIVDKCGGTSSGAEYNPSTESCCGSNKYTHASQFCQIGTNAVKELCNGATYPSTQFCSGTSIISKCGGAEYNTATHFCRTATNEVKPICNGNATYTSTQYCSNGTLKSYGSITDTRDSKTYKTVEIGTQIWMAANLNYEASDSKCYDNSTANCDAYGRLYNWATAMGIDTSYNNVRYNPDSSTKYKGVCPAGWHLPNNNEWNALETAVGSSAGTKLKAASGWAENGNGTDDYGFSALPSGYCSITSSGSSYYFYNVGSEGYGYSATEYDYNWTHFRYISSSGFGSSYNYKRYLRSVRCVKD